MALRLQSKGYIIRWANYSEGRFMEGVSLTIDDEPNRCQKYPYGALSVFILFHTILYSFCARMQRAGIQSPRTIVEEGPYHETTPDILMVPHARALQDHDDRIHVLVLRHRRVRRTVSVRLHHPRLRYRGGRILSAVSRFGLLVSPCSRSRGTLR